MKKQILLKQFEYSIPPFTMAIAGLKGKHSVAEHLPLMKVIIDFENGILSLEGDWHFMMAYDKHNEASGCRDHRERVKMQAIIYPALAINLNNPESDNFVCRLKGIISDGNFRGFCSGSIAIDNVRLSNDLTSKHWNINFHIYDQFNNREIKFKLPVYTMAIDPALN